MEKLAEKFQKIFRSSPQIAASAPGRINLIGEHTDYNDGYVLPVALNLNVYFLAALRSDEKVQVWAEDFQEKEEFSIKEMNSPVNKNWMKYIKGVYGVLQQEGFKLQGIDALIKGEVPLEAGLSSSAALEVSTLYCLNYLFQMDISLEKIALYAQRAENDFVGVRCGIMDQFISVLGEKDKALFLDCETLEKQMIPVHFQNRGLRILIYNSKVQRELASSEYNKRREESAVALKILSTRGVQSYKQDRLDVLEKERKKMGEIYYKRAKHVMRENQRVKRAVKALKDDDFSTLGNLIFQSHQSLRDDYEVSCPELDLLYESAKEFKDCLGARLTGAGFGGSGFALLEKKGIRAFEKKLLREARKMNFPIPEFYVTEIGRGAAVRMFSNE
ncbi:galactokinase [bacterium]|nr:galactokinase [bacterium]